MNNEITYTKQGDYNLPDLKLPEQDNRPIGIWGRVSGGHLCRRQKHRPNRQVRHRRRRYLEQHHKVLYYNLLTSCKLHDHLADVNEESIEMYDRLVNQLVEQEGVTEQLKADNQLLWVQRMNSICSRATEIVMNELIMA